MTASCGPRASSRCPVAPCSVRSATSCPPRTEHPVNSLAAVHSHAAACVFALFLPGGEAVFRARVEALRRLYAPLATAEDVRWSEELGLGVGAIALGGPLPVEGDWLGHWG